jgi:hypothetical protein
MTTQTAEERINEVNDQLVRLLSEDPDVDFALLKERTGGLITKDAKEGNGVEIAKALVRYNRSLLSPPASKKRKRRPASKAESKTQEPAKRRGRPKGSKNKPKDTKTETETTTETTTTENPATE